MRYVSYTCGLIFGSLVLVCAAHAQRPPKWFETATGLSGYYDLQSVGNPCQHIRCNPRTGRLHAIFQIATDSLNPLTSRRGAYAYSDWGYLWNNCGTVLGNRPTDLPSLDLVTTGTAGYPIVVNQNGDSTARPDLFVGQPETSCTFTGIQLPTTIPGLSFPEVAACSDGSVIVVVSHSQTGAVYILRTTDLVTWSPPLLIPGITSRLYVVQANDSGRVGIVLRNVNESIYLVESLNNGVAWGTPVQIIPPQVVVGTDTLVTFLGADLVYRGNSPAVAVTVTKRRGTQYSHRNVAIGFWSSTTGFQIAVPHSGIFGVVDTLNRPQAYHLTVGYPSIGVSYNTLVIAFQAFRAETSAAGFNYSDVYSTYSGNGGVSWSSPIFLTYNLRTDERYPSVSKWNGPGQPFIVWQKDAEPGSHIVDGAPVSRCHQEMFWFIDLPVDEERQTMLPQRVELFQNYPNPFNPVTKFKFSIVNSQLTILKVYDVLGREVATLVNEVKPPGTYSVGWDASGVSSGVYFYRLLTTNLVQTRKLVLLR